MQLRTIQQFKTHTRNKWEGPSKSRWCFWQHDRHDGKYLNVCWEDKPHDLLFCIAFICHLQLAPLDDKQLASWQASVIVCCWLPTNQLSRSTIWQIFCWEEGSWQASMICWFEPTTYRPTSWSRPQQRSIFQHDRMVNSFCLCTIVVFNGFSMVFNCS